MSSRRAPASLALTAALVVVASACAGTAELQAEVDELRAEQADVAIDERALRERVDRLEEELAPLLAPAPDTDEVDPLEELATSLAELEDRVTALAETATTTDEATETARAAAEAAASDLRASLDEVRGVSDSVRGEVEELRTLYETLRDRLDRMQSG